MNPKRQTDPSILLSLFVSCLLGLYLLVTSSAIVLPEMNLYDAKRLLQFACLIALFAIPVFNGPVRNQFGQLLSTATGGWAGVLLTAFFTLGVVSALVHARSLMHALNSLSDVAMLLVLGLGVFVVAACRRIAGARFDQLAIALLALTGLVVGVQELVAVVAVASIGAEYNFDLALAYFSFPRFYNQMQSWMVPMLTALPLLFPRHRLVSALCIVILGLQWYLILVTGARGSFLSILTAMAVALAFVPSVRAVVLKYQLPGFALGGLLYIAVLAGFTSDATSHPPDSQEHSPPAAEMIEPPDRNGPDAASDSTGSLFRRSVGRQLTDPKGRTIMWKIMARDVQSNPLLGIGPMNYACTSPQGFTHGHNFPLQLAAEWGIPAALIACILALVAIGVMFRWIRRGEYENARQNLIAAILITAVLSAALHACLSGVLIMPASQVTGLLACGMLVGLRPSGGETAFSAAWGRSSFPGLILACGLLLLGAQEVGSMKERSDHLAMRDRMLPRMWNDAKVCTQYSRQTVVNN